MKRYFLFLFAPIFAMAEESAAVSRENPLMQTIIMFVVIGVFFYFILWRPEKKRRKQMQDLRQSMKKGDRVTAMGIIGKVEKVEEKTVILKMFDGAKIEMLKAAITDVEHQANPKEVIAEK